MGTKGNKRLAKAASEDKDVLINVIVHRRSFVQVANSTVRDPQLSFKATGLLCFLLSMPKTWKTSYRDLATRKKEGAYAIRTALNELVDAGYIIRERRQVGRGAGWTTISHVYEEPQIGPRNRKKKR